MKMQEDKATGLSTSSAMKKYSEATTDDVDERCNGDYKNTEILKNGRIEEPDENTPEKQLDSVRIKTEHPAEIETSEIVNLSETKIATTLNSVESESERATTNEDQTVKSDYRAKASNKVDLANTGSVKPSDLDVQQDDKAKIATLKIITISETKLLKQIDSSRNKDVNLTDKDEIETINFEDQKTVFMDIDLGNDNDGEVLPKCESNPEIIENTKFKIIRKRLRENLKHFHVKHHKIPDNPDFIERLKHSLLLPPHGPVAEHVTLVLMILTLWITCMSMFGTIAVPPNGTHFLLIALVVVATLVGQLFALVHLPPLLGMIVTGIALKNLPGVIFDDNWIAYSQTLRGIALVVILLQAGLGLDPVALRRLSGLVFGLAFIPGLIEASTVAVASHFLLGLPWLWGFMLGFVLAAASPAVVVPLLLALQEQGLGVAKGIPTLIIAASSVDDVLAISVFTITLGITFKPNTNIVAVVFQGPIEAIVGLLFGIFWGLLVIYIPGRDSSERNFGRIFLLLGGALLAMFGSSAHGVELPGSGALAVIVMAFVAGIGWRKQSEDDYGVVNEMLAKLWIIFQPLLFGLIGTEIRINELKPSTLGMGILVLVICLTIRIAASFAVVSFTDMTLKERFFVALAWLPKATVQAALGPLALDTAKTLGSDRADGPELIAYGEIVLTVAVLVILITAPIGAIVIRLLGPRWLSKGPEEKEDVEKNC